MNINSDPGKAVLTGENPFKSSANGPQGLKPAFIFQPYGHATHGVPRSFPDTNHLRMAPLRAAANPLC